MKISFKVKIFGLLFAFLLILTACAKNSNTNSNQNINNTNVAAINSNSNANTNSTLTYSYPGQDGKTAMELLKAKFTGITTTKSGNAEFVKGINGLEAGAKQYWGFYVNGKAASVGASDYQTKATDTIEWKLISY